MNLFPKYSAFDLLYFPKELKQFLLEDKYDEENLGLNLINLTRNRKIRNFTDKISIDVIKNHITPEMNKNEVFSVLEKYMDVSKMERDPFTFREVELNYVTWFNSAIRDEYKFLSLEKLDDYRPIFGNFISVSKNKKNKIKLLNYAVDFMIILETRIDLEIFGDERDKIVNNYIDVISIFVDKLLSTEDKYEQIKIYNEIYFKYLDILVFSVNWL